MYVNIPVKEGTKAIIDELRKVLHTKSYDDTLQKLASANSFLLMADMEGMIANTPKFERDKLERNFG
jgi:hypothetical protein